MENVEKKPVIHGPCRPVAQNDARSRHRWNSVVLLSVAEWLRIRDSQCDRPFEPLVYQVGRSNLDELAERLQFRRTSEAAEVSGAPPKPGCASFSFNFGVVILPYDHQLTWNMVLSEEHRKVILSQDSDESMTSWSISAKELRFTRWYPHGSEMVISSPKSVSPAGI